MISRERLHLLVDARSSKMVRKAVIVFFVLTVVVVLVGYNKREQEFLSECEKEMIGGKYYQDHIEGIFIKTGVYPRNNEDLMAFYKDDPEVLNKLKIYEKIKYKLIGNNDYEIWIPFSHWVSSFNVILYRKSGAFSMKVSTDKKLYDLEDNWIAIKGGSDLWD